MSCSGTRVEPFTAQGSLYCASYNSFWREPEYASLSACQDGCMASGTTGGTGAVPAEATPRRLRTPPIMRGATLCAPGRRQGIDIWHENDLVSAGH